MEAAAGRANVSRCFDVFKGASLRVAHSDWTAARFLLKMDNEKCRLLIDLYKDHRSLWEPEHRNYHNSWWGFFIPSTQLHYRRLILLLNTTYTATCFGRTTTFKQKYIIS
jgi:hypothetical protein